MSQNFKDNCYVITNLVAGAVSDLQEIEDNFNTLKTSFSGSSAPVTDGDYSTVAGLTWYDTTNTQLKYRNAANNGWMYLFPGDSSSKIWVYRNDAVEGMVVDTSVTDKLLAIKGGSQAYNVNGGNTAGSWAANHTHGPGTYTTDTRHRHGVGSSGGNFDSVDYVEIPDAVYTDYQGSTTQPVAGASGEGLSNWRPSAAVGILLKPDL